ncbi:phosphatase PAP2 family protein [Candidatus Woesearchaeota archaeon]|nr:phosphatase PAP2 family protein [Candidatus Woesearchaeota archaeon]
MSALNFLIISIGWLDRLVNEKVGLLQSPAMDKAMLVITNIAGALVMAVLSIILLSLLVYKKRWHNAALFTLSMIGGVVLELLVKLIIQRSRPGNALATTTSYSFPSGHATMAIIFFAMMAYCFKEDIKNNLWKKLFIAANIIMILLIGFSRIYLRVHWLSDVIGGLVLGGAWVLILLFAKKKLIVKNNSGRALRKRATKTL